MHNRVQPETTKEGMMISAGSPSIPNSETLINPSPIITRFIIARFWELLTHYTMAQLEECLHSELAHKQATTRDHHRRYDDPSWQPINTNQWNFNSSESRHNTAHCNTFFGNYVPTEPKAQLEESLHSELAHKQATTWDRHWRYVDISR